MVVRPVVIRDAAPKVLLLVVGGSFGGVNDPVLARVLGIEEICDLVVAVRHAWRITLSIGLR